MAWYFNFCSPHLPNDPIINFHRYVQTGTLAAFMLLYVFVHIYYKICKKETVEESESSSQGNSQSQSQSEGKSEEQKSEEADGKSVSIAAADENSSYVTFDKTTKRKQRKNEQQSQNSKEEDKNIIIEEESVGLSEIQQFFPIVFGHFAIASAFTIMYSPYAEQSLAMVLYVLLSLVLLPLNAYRKTKTTRFVWGLMALLICFIVMSALLEVGQSNYNKIDNQCFSVNYKSLY